MNSPRWGLRDGQRVLVEAYDEGLHPRGKGGKWVPSHHARMETEHFTFDTFGNSEQDARDRMDSLWKAHHIQYRNPDVASRPALDDYGVNIEPTGLKGPGHMAEYEGHLGYGKTPSSAITGARKVARSFGENPEYLRGPDNFNVEPTHEHGLRDGSPIHGHRHSKLREEARWVMRGDERVLLTENGFLEEDAGSRARWARWEAEHLDSAGRHPQHQGIAGIKLDSHPQGVSVSAYSTASPGTRGTAHGATPEQALNVLHGRLRPEHRQQEPLRLRAPEGGESQPPEFKSQAQVDREKKKRK